MESSDNKSQTVPTLKEKMRTWQFWKPYTALTIGGVAGFLYYYFVGCSSGSCAITSNPYMSIFWGAMMGYFFVNSPCVSGKC